MLREGRPGDTHTAYSCSPCWLPGGALNTTIIKDRRSPPPGPSPPRCRPSVMTGVPRSRPGWRPSGEASSARGGGGPRLPWRAQVGPGVRSTCTRQGQGGWGGLRRRASATTKGPGVRISAAERSGGRWWRTGTGGRKGGQVRGGDRRGGGAGREGAGAGGSACMSPKPPVKGHTSEPPPPTHTHRSPVQHLQRLDLPRPPLRPGGRHHGD